MDHPEDKPSVVKQATATIRDFAGKAQDALQDGETPGQWKVIVRDLVREAPLASLAVAFLIGVIVARR